MASELKLSGPLVVGSFSSDPVTGYNGEIYYNTTSNNLRQYINGAWHDVGTSSASLTGQALTNHDIIVGNSSNLSASVDTSAAGDVLADSSTALTIKSAAVTGSKIASSVALSGSPTTTTQSPGDNSTKIATTAYADAAAAAVAVTGSTSILDSSGTLSVIVDPTNALEISAGGVGIRLEATNPTLEIDGSFQLGVKLNPTGAISTSSSGIEVKVDNSTIDINGSDQLEVKSGSITSTQLNSTLYSNIILADGTHNFTANQSLNGHKLTSLAAGTTTGDSVRYEQAILVNGVNPFTANQDMGGNKLTGLANGTSTNDAVNYGQLTSISSGLVWQNSINDPDLVDDSLNTPPSSPIYSLTYIIGASPTGAWTGLAGHAVWWDGADWHDISTNATATSGQGTAVQVGDRFAVAISTPETFTFTVSAANATAGAVYTNNGYSFTVQSTITGGTTLVTKAVGFPSGTSGTLTLASGTGDSTISFTAHSEQIGGGLTGQFNKIAQITGNTPGSITYSFTTPLNNYAVNVSSVGSQHYGSSFTYNSTTSSWIDFSGPAKVSAGNALAYDGNTLNVLFDGTTIDLNTNQLEVKAGGIGTTQLAATSVTTAKLNTITDGITLDQTGTGSTLEVKAGGISATQLATAAVTATKLGTVTDGVTLDQSGAGSTIEIKTSGVGTTQLAAASVTIPKLGTITDGVTLDQSGLSNSLEIKAGGVGTTQLAASAVTPAKLGTVTDNITLDQSGTGSTLEIKAGGVGTTQLAATSVTTSKLATITDGLTLDQSGTGNTLEIKASGVNTTQLANSAVTTAKLGSVTDGITLDQSGTGSTIEVKTGGISNTQINSSAAIALSKLASLNTNRVLTSNPSGVISDTSSTDVSLLSTSLQRGSGTSALIKEAYVDSTTLTDNTSSPTSVAAFQFAFATYAGYEMTYYISSGAATPDIRLGTLRLVSNGTTSSIVDTYSETADLGVSWTTSVSGANILLNYTTTSIGTNRTIRADIKYFRV